MGQRNLEYDLDNLDNIVNGIQMNQLVSYIINKYNVSEQYRSIIKIIQHCKQHYNLEDNSNLYNNNLLKIPFFTKINNISNQELANIILTYQRLCPVENTIGQHPDASFQDLRNFGFIMDGEKQGCRYIVRQDKKNYRKIIGYDLQKNINLVQNYEIQARTLFLKKHSKCPVTGTTKNLVIEHRTPIRRLQKNNALHLKPSLTMETINNGQAERHLWVVSHRYNALKEGICKKCLKGEFPYFNNRFKDLRESGQIIEQMPQDSISCIGCPHSGKTINYQDIY